MKRRRPILKSTSKWSAVLILCTISLFVYAFLTHSLLSQHVVETSNNVKNFRGRDSIDRRCQRGYWTTDSRWVTSPECNYRQFDVSSTLTCLSKYKRILVVGDSVQRGLFWNMIGVLKGIETIDDVPSSQVRYRMIDNLAGTQKSFTNVQDQEFVVTRRKDNSLLFSIRFVYAAHVTDFAGRCEAVSAWFFQCPEPLDSVCRRTIQFILLFLNNNNNNTGSGSRTLRCKGEKHTLRYVVCKCWNVGLAYWCSRVHA